jgi:hypothetical protein
MAKDTGSRRNGTVRIEESPGLRVIIPAVKVVKPGLGIAAVSPVKERVGPANGVRQGAGGAEQPATYNSTAGRAQPSTIFAPL